ncbi:MAG: MFS transporter [Clostridia bacterium]|nr:MFS transporter [Clostridia bacterium]
MKKLSTGKVWCFAVGQLGWSILAALISSWLVSYYQPDQKTVDAGHSLFIPQGAVIFGIFTILGAITAFGRIFDAITDPLIASASDKCKSKDGRRIPFMRLAAIPFAATCILTFWSPVNDVSWINGVFLFLMLTLFYLFMTMYCTPYNALIPELGADQRTRMAISTAISFTYIAGMAVAYLAPVIWGLLEGFMDRILAIRITFTVLGLIGLGCMFVPVFTIREKDYINVKPTEGTALHSLGATFKNKDFRLFVASDIAYFLGITMFQTAMPYFVVKLLGIDEGMSSMYFVLMTALSVIFYIPITKLVPRFGKKKLILCAFVIFTVSFLYTAAFGPSLPIPPAVQGYILCALAAPAMAIFGILPQAVVADIAEYDALETGENRSGMFYAARTFAFKLGQSVAMLLVTSFATIGKETGLGYRITAITAAAVCLLGGVLFLFYNEKKIYAKILKEKRGDKPSAPKEK